MVLSNSDIVQDYVLPLGHQGDPHNARFLAKVRREIEDNGIVRPKGYDVSWHVNPEIEKHHFGNSHPMKPWRLTLSKGLIMSYGMHIAMDTYLSRQATEEEMRDFHSDDYLEYLRTAKVAMPDDETDAVAFGVRSNGADAKLRPGQILAGVGSTLARRVRE